MNDEKLATKADLISALAGQEERLMAHVEKQEERVMAHIGNLVKELREYNDERMHDAETRLLRAFSDYNNSANIRFRKLEADQQY